MKEIDMLKCMIKDFEVLLKDSAEIMLTSNDIIKTQTGHIAHRYVKDIDEKMLEIYHYISKIRLLIINLDSEKNYEIFKKFDMLELKFNRLVGVAGPVLNQLMMFIIECSEGK
jgi:hypothetical protein